jgi:divalent metal cation (Fe/Co/Zn/Cd) transporter
LTALVALTVIWSGWKLIRESIGGLMDDAVPAEVLTLVKRTISASADPALEAHDVRTRRAGCATFIDFHLVVPGAMMVSESHAMCDRLEDSLRKAIPDAVVSFTSSPKKR